MPPPILLVDDDLSLAHTMTTAIQNLGVPVEHCATGEVAVALMREKRYAVAIVDLILKPGISGIYVVNAIRQLPPDHRPTVLMITGANLENLRGVDRAVVTAVMLKPFDFQLFADYVLATYRRALNLTSEAGVAASLAARIRTFCGSCGTEIPPWISERPLLAGGPADGFEIWMDTPCSHCGTVPRLRGGRSEWTGRP